MSDSEDDKADSLTEALKIKPAEQKAKEVIPPRPKVKRAARTAKPKTEMRDQQRPDMRASMEAAEQRAREIEAGLPSDAELGDAFAAPEPPPGWSYEWKREFLLNQPDPSYMRDVEQTGWKPVPSDRHPEMMPNGSADPAVRRKGLILMERPLSITKKMRDRDNKNAREQMRSKEEQLGYTPPGTLPRDADPRTKPQISKSYEAYTPTSPKE